MLTAHEIFDQLAAIAGLAVRRDEPLSAHTRFGIGGPADIFAETASIEAFIHAFQVVREADWPVAVIGGGTNLIVSDKGFPGVLLKFRADGMIATGDRIVADAGAELENLVDFSIEQGLQGLETLTGIPGSVGAAIYGNAGAYGHSISESVLQVRFYDGAGIRTLDKAGCEFRYRESVFKRHKDWFIFSAELQLRLASPEELRRKADEIRRIRDAKYPPTMRCAGSIFKNFLLGELPPAVAALVPADVIREDKVPAAWFLDQVGARGIERGDIHVAAYHANLVYNAGAGTAADLCELIAELKRRVLYRYGLELDEEVQYVGFDT